MYITEGLEENLRAIPLEGMTVDGVSDAVKQACGEAGVRLATQHSLRSKGPEPRVLARELRCRFGMPNRNKARAANGGCEAYTVQGNPCVLFSKYDTFCRCKPT